MSFPLPRDHVPSEPRVDLDDVRGLDSYGRARPGEAACVVEHAGAAGSGRSGRTGGRWSAC